MTTISSSPPASPATTVTRVQWADGKPDTIMVASDRATATVLAEAAIGGALGALGSHLSRCTSCNTTVVSGSTSQSSSEAESKTDANLTTD